MSPVNSKKRPPPFELVRPARSPDDGFRKYRSLDAKGIDLPYLKASERPARLLNSDLCGSIERSYTQGSGSWGPCVFDFDAVDKSPEGMQQALEGVRLLVAYFLSLGLRPGYDFRVRLSGGYGFHVLVHPAVFDGCAPRQEWHLYHKNLAVAVLRAANALGYEDQQIYSRNRLLRLEGAEHRSTHLFCVELPPERLLDDFTVDDYKHLARVSTCPEGVAERPWPDEIAVSPVLVQMGQAGGKVAGLRSRPLTDFVNSFPCLRTMWNQPLSMRHNFNTPKMFFTSCVAEHGQGLSDNEKRELVSDWSRHKTGAETIEDADRRQIEALRSLKFHQSKVHKNGTALKAGACFTYIPKMLNVSCSGCPVLPNCQQQHFITKKDLREGGVSGSGFIIYAAIYSLKWNGKTEVTHADIAKQAAHEGRCMRPSRATITKWMKHYSSQGWLEYERVTGKGFKLNQVTAFRNTNKRQAKYKPELAPLPRQSYRGQDSIQAPSTKKNPGAKGGCVTLITPPTSSKLICLSQEEWLRHGETNSEAPSKAASTF
ncbi:hypothetical protein KQI52_00025 [bacterium]|nr:hypothetical protein [bacterium]